eukprot:g3390.t1
MSLEELASKLSTPSVYENPVEADEIFTQLRQSGRIVRVESDIMRPYWAVTKAADIRFVESNSDKFHAGPWPAMMPTAQEERNLEVFGSVSGPTTTLVAMDGDVHRKHRVLAQTWFSPKNIKTLAPSVDAIAETFVNKMAAMDGECDFVQDIAFWYPLRVVNSILGVPETVDPIFLRLTQELFASADPQSGVPVEDVLSTMAKTNGEFLSIFEPIIADRRANPTDDLASTYANATIDGEPLGVAETLGLFLITATAGHDTTSATTAGGLKALIDHPDEFQKLRDNPDLLPNAIEEFLRWVAPVKHFGRTAMEDVEIGGQLVRKDAAVEPVETEVQSERELATVFVTARKRSETLQEVPVTVTSVGSEAIEKFQIDRIDDLAARVPGLNIQTNGAGQGAQVTLRGVGSSAIATGFDSAVAFDFDGVIISSQRIIQSGFVDAAQVDVLRGPQSLFFGKSASGGVLSIKSADPTPNWEFNARASYEFEEDGTIFGGYVSGPITETFGVRVAAQYTKVDEFITNTAPGVANPERGQEDILIRGTLDWQPTDRFDANFKLSYVGHENDGALGNWVIDCGADGLPDPVEYFGGAILIPAGYGCNPIDDSEVFIVDGATALTATSPDFLVSATAPFNGSGRSVGYGESDVYIARLNMDYDLTDTLTLTSVTGYFDQESADGDTYAFGGVGPAFTPVPGLTVADIAPALAATNGDGVILGGAAGFAFNSTDQFSQEFRLASDFDGPLNFMLGAFYEDRTIGLESFTSPASIGFVAPDPITGSTFDYHQTHLTDSETFSVFASSTYDFTDQWQLTGGLRWTDESKSHVIAVPYAHFLISGLPDSAFLPTGFVSAPIEFEDDNISPEVTLRYTPNADLNFFVSYKTGFKSGGIDSQALPTVSLLGLVDTDPTVFAAAADPLTFESETGAGGEFGVKSRWLDGALTLNATAYRYVYEDLQLQNFNGSTIQFDTFNASELTTQGLEVTTAWNTPVDGLSLSSNVAYLDSSFTAPFPLNGLDGVPGTADDVDLNGRDAALAPEFSGNFALDWFRPVSDTLEIGANANVRFSTDYLSDNESLNDPGDDGYMTLDGVLSLGHQDGLWTLSVVGVNITEETYITNSSDRPFVPTFVAPENRDRTIGLNRGRQIFVELSTNF